MRKEDLLKIIGSDGLGLLNLKKTSSTSTTEERLIASFKEINDYVRETGRQPAANNENMREFTLYTRLESVRTSNDKVSALLEYDEFNLLGATKTIKTINDIFETDVLGLLNDKEDSIFKIKNVPENIDTPDYIARRTPCKDFDKFEHLFKECHNELESGKKLLRPFTNEQQINKESFFILRGIMVYIQSVGNKETKKNKVNARLRCIFENGTESDMLLRSLARELYKDGRRIFDADGSKMDRLEQVTVDDIETGYIYVLRSLSNNSQISSIKNLYKIGFSINPIEERIKNSEEDPTFLMGKVAVVAVFKCLNLNPQKMESLLHTFFGRACLDIDIYDTKGKRYVPREWFIAPLNVIENAITLLVNGEIVHYTYDEKKQEIALR